MSLYTQDELAKIVAEANAVAALTADAAVPEWEKPAHEEIDLATADPDELGLDPFANEGDARLMDAITEAKSKAAAKIIGVIEAEAAPAEPPAKVSASSKFREIALAAAARGESRVLPIAVGGKNPLIKWKDTAIDLASEEEWNGLYLSWIEEQAAKHPDVNVAVIAKPYEKLFIDEDDSARFREGYEKFSGEPFPKTYTTSARTNRCQSHWLQTDKTRAMGNVPQGSTIEGILSVRQNNLYVLAEGSQHKNGVDVYKSVDGSVAIPMPDKMVDYIQSIRTDRNKETGDFTKKPEGWLDAPFIHHNIDNQLIAFAGHYISAKNIKDPEELYTLLVAKVEKNGCFYEDGKTPFACNLERVREIANDKVKVWKTGEEIRKQGQLEFTRIPAQMVLSAVPQPSVGPTVQLLDEVIPEFDPSCITGLFEKIVNLVCEGTTIPPQFPFLAAKVFIGARMAGKMTFENLDADSSYYGTAIAETGTGKGLAWRRTVEGVFQTGNMLDSKVKIIYSADSGAGLKDTFFEPPEDQPVICYIDEVTSLGHKAGEKKNPEIVDTIIELADSNRISRVLASRKGQKANRTTNNARLSLYMCGQNGEVFMSSFAGRTKLGIYDRLYPEYSPNVEAGDLPEVDQVRAARLFGEICKMNFSGEMKMSPEVKIRLDAFWKSQTAEIRKKPRFKKHLMLDMYMAAFGRGVRIAELEDLDVAVKIFARQIIIRKTHFSDEVPDRVGLYVGKLKTIFENMRRRLNQGETIGQVAMSLRDLQTSTFAYQYNELSTFNVAWRNWEAQVAKTSVVAKNGHAYTKFVPVPNEDEIWTP